MKQINLNDIAMDVAMLEGKKEELSIAQVKEVIRIIFTKLTLADICRIWFKYNG